MTTPTNTEKTPDAKDTAKDKAPAASKTKAAAKVEKAAPPVAVLPKGKGTQRDKPPKSAPPPIPRSEERDEKKPRGEDTLRQNTDKARWEFGNAENKDDIPTLLAEQRAIREQQASDK